MDRHAIRPSSIRSNRRRKVRKQGTGMQDKHFLNSWKEVADYVGLSARTLQRWEKRWKLPMHRPAGRMRSAVIAVTSEIDEWIQQAPVGGITKVALPVEAAEPTQPTIRNGLPLLLCIDDDADSGAVRKRFLEA